jgi:RNA polymerase subunit RPABC4/transcription elongation factor Spt4
MPYEYSLVVLSCSNCGNVFPLHPDDEHVCPLCNSDDVHPAGEPLL